MFRENSLDNEVVLDKGWPGWGLWPGFPASGPEETVPGFSWEGGDEVAYKWITLLGTGTGGIKNGGGYGKELNGKEVMMVIKVASQGSGSFWRTEVLRDTTSRFPHPLQIH